MSRIPHAHRRAGRYVFRRRIHFRNLISKPVTIALQTADPKLARQRAAILSARFVVVKSSVGRDGEKAGEKRFARRRMLPIHPELIRLGFLDYVKAILAEGHTALFPELYLFEAKRGGGQFYDRSWRFMVEWIGDRMTLPANDKGKIPDIHSIRSLGSSFYEIDGVNEILRADIMGHARQGTNAKHYSKRLQTEGIDVVLAERRQFLMRYVPVITAHLHEADIHSETQFGGLGLCWHIADLPLPAMPPPTTSRALFRPLGANEDRGGTLLCVVKHPISFEKQLLWIEFAFVRSEGKADGDPERK